MNGAVRVKRVDDVPRAMWLRIVAQCNGAGVVVGVGKDLFSLMAVGYF